MKNLAVIEIHSFVDLITNSSSELFVCDTNKSLTAVKEIVEKIIKNYYDEQGESVPDSKTIWTTIFEEPSVIKKDYVLSEYPDQEDVKKITDWNYYDKQQHAASDKVNKKFVEDPKFVEMSWDEKTKDPEWIAFNDARAEYRNELFDPIWADRNAARERIAKYFGFKNADEAGTYASWNISVKKGNIVLYSADDNSVPYEVWDRINSILNARNYHLG